MKIEFFGVQTRLINPLDKDSDGDWIDDDEENTELLLDPWKYQLTNGFVPFWQQGGPDGVKADNNYRVSIVYKYPSDVAYDGKVPTLIPLSKKSLENMPKIERDGITKSSIISIHNLEGNSQFYIKIKYPQEDIEYNENNLRIYRFNGKDKYFSPQNEQSPFKWRI